jgi:hypothetical protein
MKLIKAILWSATASLFILILALPTLNRAVIGVRNASSSSSDSHRNAGRFFPPPTPAQRQALILALSGLSIYLAASQLQASRRRALRKLPPVKLNFEGPARREPMLWRHDVGVMESIGSVGLLQEPPLNFGRRRDTNDELLIPL